MDLEVLKTQLPDLKVEAKRHRQHEAEARSRAEHLERIIASVEALAGPDEGEPERTVSAPAPESSNGKALSGIDAVRAILKSADRAWKAAEVLDIMRERGWGDPHAEKPARPIAVALSRLERRGEAERVGYGRYRWKEGGESQ
jgi:hypothetical protein